MTKRRVLQDDLKSGGVAGDSVVAWVHASHADAWWRDTAAEATRAEAADHRDDGTEKSHALRRQIVLATCFIESFFFELVRDAHVVPVETLPDYFGGKHGVTTRIKTIARRLHEEGSLQEAPDFETPRWQDFCTLVQFRDNLVHATVSLPVRSDDERPRPKLSQLRALPPDWPLETVEGLAELLYSWVGRERPKWLDRTVT